MEYIRGIITLFLVLTVLLHLPPGKTFQKYIRFFAELILTIALLSPVLSFVCDSEKFLNLVEYEEFTEELEAVSNDMQHMEYLYEDYHKASYEKAIAEKVKGMAEEKAFVVREAVVELSDAYEVEHITLRITKETEEQVTIQRITLSEATGAENEDTVCAELRQELMEFYQVDESQIEIQYEGREGA